MISKMNMLKRPLDDDISESPTKKLRFEDLKSNLDALLAQASKHHEEARLAAVDSAYDLEEAWKDAEEKKNASEAELAELKKRKEVCSKYISDMKSSQAFKMLENVGSTDVNGIEKLTEDRQKLNESLKNLESLSSHLETEHTKVRQRLEKESEMTSDLKEKYEGAEAKAQKITKLAEN